MNASAGWWDSTPGRAVTLPERPAAQDVQYYFECPDYRATERKLSAFLADFQDVPAEKLKPHQHDGVEFLCILKGSLTIKIAAEEFLLESEDAIYLDSAVAHIHEAWLQTMYRSNRYGIVRAFRTSLLPIGS
jgi:hypothetical protein